MSALYCRNDGRVYSYCTMFFENCNSIVAFSARSSFRCTAAILEDGVKFVMLVYAKRAHKGTIPLLRLHLAHDSTCL